MTRAQISFTSRRTRANMPYTSSRLGWPGQSSKVRVAPPTTSFASERGPRRTFAAKVRRGPRSDAKDVVGGATLTFELCPGHPNLEEVYGILARVRRDVNDIWARVMQYNDQHPFDDAHKIKVTVYFGQNVNESDDDVREEAS